MIDPTLVQHVALLARLEVPVERLPALTREMASIIGYVEQLKDLDVSGIPPLSHGGTSHDVFRDDVPRPSLPRADLLAVAPRHEGPYYVVPKVIGDGA
jgi:aspartyl-tRNA(Asn)/glutamyl-tRNA(Gln) amidotransferase subunit C